MKTDSRTDPLLRRMVDKLPSMVAYWDTELRCKFANQAYSIWFGVPPHQVMGRHLSELLGEHLFALNLPHAETALRGEEQRFERAIPGPDGKVRHALLHYLPDTRHGKVMGFIAHITEVSMLKSEQRAEAEAPGRSHLERQLHAARQALAVTLATMEAGFIQLDAAGKVLHMNEAAERMTGWPLAEARGVMVWTVFPREGRPAAYLQRNPLDVLQELDWPVTRAQEAVLQARDGRRLPVEVKVALMHGPEGRPEGMAIVFRDISTPRDTQLDVQWLAAIVESSQDAIISKTLDGRIVSWNGSAAQLLGYSADEAVGMSVLELIPPERRDEEMMILTQLSRGARIPALQTVRLAKDGRRIDVSLSISPIRDSKGTIVGAAKIVRDLSREKAAENARLRADLLEAQNRQLQESMRAKSLFLASMSHELRTPLNAVIGFAQLLQAKAVPAGSTKQDEFIEHIASSGRHLLDMINDLLDLSKVESGKFEFAPSAFDVPSVLNDLVATMSVLAERKRIAISVQPDPAVRAVVLDPSRFRQIVYNYLSNAIKFTPEGGAVTLRTRWRDEMFVLEVEDTGPGISAADQQQLFSEFKQLRQASAGSQEGTGLGLALTRKLVEAQGGSAGLRSVPGQGSVFYAVLPLHHRPPSAGHGAMPPKARVLVADDDHAAREGLVAELSTAGFDVAVGGSPEEVFALSTQARADSLALGLRFAGTDGLGLLDRLRPGHAPGGPPVVALTVPSSAGEVASFAMTDVLRKPASLDELRAAFHLLQRPAGRRMKVMVVDDDAHARTLMHALLAQLDVDAVLAVDGEEALMQLERSPPDAVVLDLLMPRLDGFSVLDLMRSQDDWRHIPVFVWTSFALSDEERRRLADGATVVLHKGGGLVEQVMPALRRWALGHARHR